MNAINYLKEKTRLTHHCGIPCEICPLYIMNNGKDVSCGSLEDDYPELAITMVKKWARENPLKTRQSDLLKLFPNTPIYENECVDICPTYVDKEFSCPDGVRCCDCRKKYWLEEVEE